MNAPNCQFTFGTKKSHNHSRSLGDEVNHGNPIQFFPQSWDTRKIWFSYTMKMDEHGPGHIKIQPISSNDFGWAIMHWSFHRQFRMVDQWHISDVTLLQVWTLHAIMSLIYCIVICFVSLFSCDKTHTNKQEKTTFKTRLFMTKLSDDWIVFVIAWCAEERLTQQRLNQRNDRAGVFSELCGLAGYVVSGCCCVFRAHGVINLDPVANGIPSGKLT